MNTERLHDALGLIDDELIEAVEKLRGRKKYSSLRRFTAAAACFCVVALVLTVWVHIENYDSAPGDGFTEGSPIDTSEELDGAPGTGAHAPEDGVGENNTEAVNDGVGDSERLASMLVKITDWHDDGFEGIVTEVTEGEFVELGEHVNVIFSGGVKFDLGVADGFKYDPDKANASECGIPEGEVVRIYYSYRHGGDGIEPAAIAHIVADPNE